MMRRPVRLSRAQVAQPKGSDAEGMIMCAGSDFLCIL